MAGLQQNRAVHGRGRAVEFASGDVVGDQPAHQVVARFAFLARHQLAHVVEHGADRRGLLLVGRSASRGRSCGGAGRTHGLRRARRAAARSPARAPAARSRGPDRRAARLDHVVEESVDQLLDLRTHRLGSPKGEVPSHHPSQPVVLGIVDARRRSPACCRRRSSPHASGRVFARQARIGQGRPDVLVAADHPRWLVTRHRANCRPSAARQSVELGRGLQRATGIPREGTAGSAVPSPRAEVVVIAAPLIDSRLPIRPERRDAFSGSQLSVTVSG